jgi:hypothetical protein
MRQQRRHRAAGRGEVAGQIGDRQRRRLAVGNARSRLRHPRTAALAGACVQVGIEPGEHRAVGVDQVVIAGVRVPGGYVRPRDQADAEQALQQRGPPRDDAVDREIGAHRLFVDRVLREP